MAIHELTANAAKYGALSVYGGKVEVTWSVTIDAYARTLDVRLGRKRRPARHTTSAQGFGSRLLAFVLPGQIQARSQVDFAAHGVRVHCALPLPADRSEDVKVRADL